MVAACPSDNTIQVDQEAFWNGHWDAHKIGWLISGTAAAISLFISLITIFGHGRNYHRPNQQRQIIRILLFAPIFAIISFFSYRFFRNYTYYELVEIVWEAIAIAAFLILILNYIGEDEGQQRNILAQKDKKKLPLPFCCFRYRPSKAYYLVLIKWGVVQYCFVRPALSIAGIVLEYYDILCESTLSYKYGYVYLLAIDFTSISVALYALFVLYALIKEDLQGRRPLAKFLSVKAAIFLTFYQAFIFDFLQDKGVIKGTAYWTPTNVSDGLNALCTSLEMVIVAAFQVWAFDWREYKEIGKKMARDEYGDLNPKKPRRKHTNPLYAILHALWLGDLFMELWHSMRFAFDRMRGKAYTRQDARFNAGDIVAAFGADGRHDRDSGDGVVRAGQREAKDGGMVMASVVIPREDMSSRDTQVAASLGLQSHFDGEDTLTERRRFERGGLRSGHGKSQDTMRSGMSPSRSSTSLPGSDQPWSMDKRGIPPPLPSSSAFYEVSTRAAHYRSTAQQGQDPTSSTKEAQDSTASYPPHRFNDETGRFISTTVEDGRDPQDRFAPLSFSQQRQQQRPGRPAEVQWSPRTPQTPLSPLSPHSPYTARSSISGAAPLMNADGPLGSYGGGNVPSQSFFTPPPPSAAAAAAAAAGVQGLNQHSPGPGNVGTHWPGSAIGGGGGGGGGAGSSRPLPLGVGHTSNRAHHYPSDETYSPVASLPSYHLYQIQQHHQQQLPRAQSQPQPQTQIQPRRREEEEQINQETSTYHRSLHQSQNQNQSQNQSQFQNQNQNQNQSSQDMMENGLEENDRPLSWEPQAI